MKKRIYKNMLLCSFLCITVITLLLSFVFYGLLSRQMSEEVKTAAQNIAGTLSLQAAPQVYLTTITFPPKSARVTLIDEKGEVLYDSYKKTGELDNHAQRPEVKQALLQGEGEYKRFSDSLDKETYYYAVKLSDGDIIRLAKTTDTITDIFFSALPAIFFSTLLTIIICLFISKRLTQKIVAPINALELEDENKDIYEELSPLVNKIAAQRKQISLQMTELEKRADTIQSIIKDMHEGLVFLDTNANILSINQSAVKLFGETAHNYVGENILQLTRNPDIMDNVKKALQGEKSNLALTLNEHKLDTFINPVLSEEQLIGAILIFLDVTDKALSEKMRREFSANVSHELKTPLTSILGFSEMIENGMAQQGDVEKFAGKIKAEVIRLIKLIENIIKLSELDENSPKRDFETFSLLALAKERVENLDYLAKEKGIEIKISDEQLDIFANKSMISELLTNLIDNAIKYNKTNGGIAIELSKNNDYTQIVVQDTGIGISQEHLKRVFERFYRIDPSRSKKTGGSGLGLSIVKHLAEYHNGCVEILSKEAEGTTVIVKIKA